MVFIRGARQLLTLRGPSPRRGVQLTDLGVIADGSILIDGEKVHAVGPTRRIENMAAARSAKVIDVTGKVVLPGFVDSHTRLIFPPRLLGSLPAGHIPPDDGFGEPPTLPMGASIRRASPKALRLSAMRWVRHFAANGTTTLEVRSAQGLSESSELKGLKVARSLDGAPLDVVPTFSVTRPEPADFMKRPAELVGRITEVLLPLVRRRRLAAFCEVDCDQGGLGAEGTRMILEAASRLGFLLKVQTGRTACTGGVALAVEFEAASVDHLQFASDADLAEIVRSSTVATLLPGVAYYDTANRYPPARALIDRGAAVALASGFGPDYSPTLSMPTVISLACRQMRMAPAEAIAAATVNGAAAMARASIAGSLEPGKQADIAVFDVADYREITHFFGFNLCVMTMKKGKVVYRGPATAIPVA